MPYTNISAVLSAADKTAIIGHINAITALLPFLINLTEEEKIALAKMGDKRLPFVTKAMEYAATNPTLVPGFLSLPEAQKDFNLNNDLRLIFEPLSQLSEGIEETGMAVGAEEYDFARAFYANVQEAAKRNVPGSGTIASDLGELFAGQGNDNSTASPTGTFKATPSSIEAGQTSTLEWKISGAAKRVINNGIGEVEAEGNTIVSPAVTTPYTLKASAENEKTLTTSATVTVTPPPAS